MFSFCENAVGLQEFWKLNMLKRCQKHFALIIRLSAEWNGSSLKKTKVPLQRDRSHLGQMPILLVWKRKRVEFRERESYIFSFLDLNLSKKTLRCTHYTPHTQTTSVVLPPSKSHVSRVDHIITVLSRCGHGLNWVSVKYVQALQ